MKSLADSEQNILIDKVSDDIELSNISSINFKGLPGDKNNYYDKKLIITIVSNKGGVGKTSIAIAVAMFFSKEIKKKILLLELDSSPGDFGVIFDIENNKSLELALRFPEKYNEYVKNIYKNVDALKGMSNPLIAENIKKDAVNLLVDFISKDYDYIIVDTQTVINGPVLDILKLSDEILAISEYSLESIARVSSLIDTLVKKFSIPEYKIKFIVNKRKFLHIFKVWDISKIIKMPIYAFIRFDGKFSKSKFIFNKGSIFNTRFFKEIKKIFKKNIGINNDVER